MKNILICYQNTLILFLLIFIASTSSNAQKSVALLLKLINQNSTTQFEKFDFLCELFVVGFGYQIEAYILVYQNKRLNIRTHPKTEKIIEIRTDLLDITNFPKR